MIRKFPYLNGVAITCVVLFHSTGMGFVAMTSWAQRYGAVPGEQFGSIAYYYFRFIEQLVVFSIPIFLIVSGYFIGIASGKNKATLKWKVVFTRIYYLAIPYLIWSTIWIALRFLEGKSLPPSRIVGMILTGQANEVYYFIPLLIQFYLLAPILIRWEKANWKSLLAVTGILQLFIAAIAYPIFLGRSTPFWTTLMLAFPKWLFTSRIFWFSLGIVLANHLQEFKQSFYPWRWWLLVGAFICIFVGIFEWELYFRLSGLDWLSYGETIVDSVYALAIILGLLAFENPQYPLFNFFSWVGPKSYGIYLVHAVVIEYLSRGIYHFAPGILGKQSLYQPILIVAGLAIPIGLMALIDRSPFRRFYPYLFGK